MASVQLKERTAAKPSMTVPPVGFSIVKAKPKITPRIQVKPLVERTKQQIASHAADSRFQHELKEMQETEDLRKIDDDVEDAATLFEWYAPEHTHQPKSAVWYIALAAGSTAVVAGLALFGNIIGAITIAFAAALTYRIAQHDIRTIRYRIMVDGVAMNNVLYHFRDLQRFNIVYQPGHTKTVIIHSKHHFTPLLHMEIGDADPVAIRDILLEFVPEDIELDEPLVDILARRLGF
jgi:hypothetical protein